MLFGASGTLSLLLRLLLPLRPGSTLTMALGALLGVAAIVGWLGTFLVLWSERRAAPAL